ncbi:MAG: response regulator [Quisquiliibacterium sp.]
MAEILVVDDEVGIRELLSEILGDEGHSVLLAESAQQARKVREESPLDLVLLDIWMPDTDGVTLLKEWAAGGKLTMPVIMMSGHATIDTAVEATRIGALDFLEKPIALQKLLKAVEQGLARNKNAPASHAVAAAPQAATVAAPTFVSGVSATQTESVQFASQPADTDLRAGAPASVLLRELPIDLPLREARDAFERAYFEHHLAREQGSMTRVAERTGLERTHLYRKLKQLGIDLSRGAYRKSGG